MTGLSASMAMQGSSQLVGAWFLEEAREPVIKQMDIKITK